MGWEKSKFIGAVAATFFAAAALAAGHSLKASPLGSNSPPVVTNLRYCGKTKSLPAGNFDLHIFWDGLKVMPFDPSNLSKRLGTSSSESTVNIDFPEFFGTEKAWSCYQEIQRVARSRLKALDATGYSNGGAALLDFAKKVCAAGGEIREATLTDYVPRITQQFAEFFGWHPPPRPGCIKSLVEHRQGPGWGLSGRPIAGADFSFTHNGDNHISIVRTVGEFNREKAAADAAAAASEAEAFKNKNAPPVLASGPSTPIPDYFKESTLGLNLGGKTDAAPAVASVPPGGTAGASPTTGAATAGKSATKSDGEPDVAKSNPNASILIVPGGRRDADSSAQVSVQNNQQIGQKLLPEMPFVLMPAVNATDTGGKTWVYYYYNGELMSLTTQDRAAGDALADHVQIPMKPLIGRHTFISVPMGTHPEDVKLSKNRSAITFQVNGS